MKNLFLLGIAICLLSLFACQKEATPERDCTNSCQNGGQCINNECECPPLYSGLNCEYKALPKMATIENLTITNYRLKNDVAKWDSDNDADIYIEIFQRGSSNVFKSDTFPDLPQTKPLSLIPNYTIEYVQDTVFIDVLDVDSNGVEFVQPLDFKIPQITPHHTGAEAPTEFSYTIQGCTIDVKMSYTY